MIIVNFLFQFIINKFINNFKILQIQSLSVIYLTTQKQNLSIFVVELDYIFKIKLEII